MLLLRGEVRDAAAQYVDAGSLFKPRFITTERRQDRLAARRAGR
jgi:hypothetical protein